MIQILDFENYYLHGLFYFLYTCFFQRDISVYTSVPQSVIHISRNCSEMIPPIVKLWWIVFLLILTFFFNKFPFLSYMTYLYKNGIICCIQTSAHKPLQQFQWNLGELFIYVDASFLSILLNLQFYNLEFSNIFKFLDFI